MVVDHVDIAGAAGGVEQRLPLRFVGSGSEYFRIWVVNLVLTLVTLGLYYPFAKVRRLKYFHGATEAAGHPLSFHANPWAMFRGYVLVALMTGAYALAGQFSPVAGLVAFLIVATVWPALWHSSLRFRLANTGWHGLRLRFTGTRGGAYAALAPGFVLGLVLIASTVWLLPAPVPPGPRTNADAAQGASAVLVGALLPLLMMLAAPWLLWLLRRYQHRHYALGSDTTRFEVGVGAFYWLGLRLLGVGLLAMALAGGVVFGLFALLGPGEPPGGADTPLRSMLPVLMGMGCAVLVMQVVLLPWATARTQNLVWNGTHSQGVRFHSQLRFGALLRLTLKNWLLILLTLGLYLPFAAVATARLRLESVDLLLRVDPDTLATSAKEADEVAAGDAAADLLGMDIGL